MLDFRLARRTDLSQHAAYLPLAGEHEPHSEHADIVTEGFHTIRSAERASGSSLTTRSPGKASYVIRLDCPMSRPTTRSTASPVRQTRMPDNPSNAPRDNGW